MGCHPRLLFNTIQNKAKQNTKPEWPLAESCAVRLARGLPGLLAVEEEKGEEEKDSGVCSELSLEGGGGEANTHLFSWPPNS